MVRAVIDLNLKDSAAKRRRLVHDLDQMSQDDIRALAISKLYDQLVSSEREIVRSLERKSGEPTPEQKKLRSDIEKAQVKTISSLITKHRMKWTAALLDSEIALGDGRRFTYGTISLDAANVRRAMLNEHATAVLESAYYITEVIHLLTTSGKRTLNDYFGRKQGDPMPEVAAS